MDILPSLQSRTLVVVFTSRSTIIPSLIAELALLGPVSVLDGGNCFPAYRTAKLIRRKSNQLEAISKRIFLRRAFTCYQMVNLLETTPATIHPNIILNLLSTFQDDQVSPNEANRLFEICFTHIECLSLSAPIAINLDHNILEEKAFLLQKVCKRADQIFRLPSETFQVEKQLSLFQGS